MLIWQSNINGLSSLLSFSISYVGVSTYAADDLHPTTLDYDLGDTSLTGAALGRGPSFVHDLWARIRNSITAK